MRQSGYAAQRSIQILVALLREHNVRHAVLSPGTRNMALVKSLEDDPFFTCHSVVDERSAAYFAVGLSIAHDAPVLISCTGATAARNYLPAMTEAFYRGIPLLVVTAGDGARSLGQEVMQTIDQMEIPADAVKYSVRLPLVDDPDDEAFCTRLVNEALLELDHHGSGPVHINLTLKDSWVGLVPELPPARKISRVVGVEDLPPIQARRIMVVVGQHRPFRPSEQAALDEFSTRYGAMVYTNRLSNYAGPHSVMASTAMEAMDARTFAAYAPDLLITVGGQTGDYPLYNRMRGSSIEHWRVSEDGAIRDTYGNLKKVFECTAESFFRAYVELRAERASKAFAESWRRAQERCVLPGNLPLSHALVAKTLAPSVPAGSVMHFAILSSLRNWNYVPLHDSIACYSNVAAFGIDGCLSTFLGHASAIEGLTFLVIGDLSFFYDMNAVGIRALTPNARVVLVNNGGGGEFHLYDHEASQFGEGTNRHIAAGGHSGSARGWVESMGWDYIGVRAKADLGASVERLVDTSPRPVMMEVFTSMATDSDAVRMIREANAVTPMNRRIAKRMPPKAKVAAKRILGR